MQSAPMSASSLPASPPPPPPPRDHAPRRATSAAVAGIPGFCPGGGARRRAGWRLAPAAAPARSTPSARRFSGSRGKSPRARTRPQPHPGVCLPPQGPSCPPEAPGGGVRVPALALPAQGSGRAARSVARMGAWMLGSSEPQARARHEKLPEL
ncbi:atherin-like [Zalophus californianus]|uniref:Atherin-like n=1 Tax=Zalophus californianus TaxID=9704 RepID=A0A6J2DEL3_ZALCA|nr:atherin-like [Zalophus californianus]